MKKETTREAAVRHRLTVATLYRRLCRLQDSGKVTLSPGDYVAGCLYLDSVAWDEVCEKTLAPGRPRKTVESRMIDKGYRYRLEFLSRDCAPLYAKTLADIGPLMRQWPEDRFNVTDLSKTPTNTRNNS